MAQFSIVVVPTNRDFIPDPDAVGAAAELLQSFYPERESGADEQAFPLRAEVKAGDLELGGEAAFARFVLSIRDPGDPVSLQPGQEATLGKLLGCEVKGIVEVRG